MDSLLKRVEAIALATSSQSISENDKNISDEFIQIKRKLSIQISEIRNDIKDRNDYANLPGGCPNKNILSRKAANIENKIKLAYNELKSMRKIVKEDEKMMKKENQNIIILNNRYKMCNLIEEHIVECEKWSKGLAINSIKEDPSKKFLLKGSRFNDEMALDEELQPINPTQTELENIDDIEEWRLLINE